MAEIINANTALAPRAETAAEVLAEQAKAVVQARYAMALKRPRDWDQVRQSLLRECDRSSFAETAMYHKPVGGTSITGLSIRFAEAALRIMGNVLPEAQVIYDDADRRIVRVTVTDLESNVSYSRDMILAKTVERSKPREGQRVLGQRLNSYGKPVFLVEATDDDLAAKEAALTSKSLRQNGLRLVPGDLLEECAERIGATVTAKVATDPDAERKRIVDAFGRLGVRATELRDFCGAVLDNLSPTELAGLRGVYQAIKDGETNWRDVVEQRAKARGEDHAGRPAASKTSRLKERMGIAEPAPAAVAAPVAAEAEAAPDPEPTTAPRRGQHLDFGD